MACYNPKVRMEFEKSLHLGTGCGVHLLQPRKLVVALGSLLKAEFSGILQYSGRQVIESACLHLLETELKCLDS